jgi:outer membrane protein
MNPAGERKVRFLSVILQSAGTIMNGLSRIVLVLLAAGACAAQTPAALTLDDCVRLAVRAPSSVVAARQQLLIARYGIAAARAGLLPHFAIANAFTYNSPLRNGPTSNGPQSFLALNGIREYQTAATVNLNVDTSGRTRAELARARADLAVATANLTLSERDLKRLVTTAYYRLLLARRLVSVTRDALGESQNFQKRVQALFDGGEAAQADVIKASSDVAFQQQAVSNAELEAKLANHDLAAFWTADVTPELNVADSLDAQAAPETPAATGSPFLGRIEFRLFDAQKTGFLADARRARADLLPNTSITYQYGLDSLRLNTDDLGHAVFFHLDIPVFDWFRARSAVQQFRQQAAQVDTSRQEAERAFSRDYQDALARVNQIYQQLTMTESQVQLSTDNLRLSRVRYEGGEGLALDVVAAQNQLAQARTNYFAAKANYLNAKADLEVAAGR